MSPEHTIDEKAQRPDSRANGGQDHQDPGKAERRDRWDQGPVSPTPPAADREAASNKPDVKDSPKTKGKKAFEIAMKAIEARKQDIAQRRDPMRQEGVAEAWPCGCLLMIEEIEQEDDNFDIDIYGDEETRQYFRRLKRCRSHGS